MRIGEKEVYNDYKHNIGPEILLRFCSIHARLI